MTAEPMMFTKVCWIIVCPLMLLAILIVSLYLWEDPLYGGKNGVGTDLSTELGCFLTIFPS